MGEWKADRIGSALLGENPTVLARMKSGFVVFGDNQFLPGYCVLLAYPQVTQLNDLTYERRSEFLLDMSIIGDAITEVCSPMRVNYEILGNTDQFLHAHIFPRHSWEEERFIKYPTWEYVRELWDEWAAPDNQWNDEKYTELRSKLRVAIEGLTNNVFGV